MAEIKIEKKQPIWPWIVGLLILGALLYFFVFADNNNDDDVEQEATTEEQVFESNNDVSEIRENDDIVNYTEYVQNPDMGVDHEYTNGAIAKLIAATRSVASELNVDINSDLTEANRLGEEITKDPAKLNHADKIKNSAQIIANALKTIVSAKTPDLQSELTQVENSIAKINPDINTLDQKDAIKAFFENSGNLLTSIKNNNGQ